VVRAVRWGVAGLVTIAAFAVVTWVAGDFVLTAVLKSQADRWVVASALGVAVAALTALWGHSWAGEETADAGNAGGPAEPVRGAEPVASGERSITAKGNITGIASSGDDATNIQRR
jgi:hypothetical protein